MKRASAGIVCSALIASLLLFGCRGNTTPTGALQELKVSPGTLQPAFTPEGHDYGVICSEGKNTWNVAATPNDSQAKVAIAGADPNGQVDATENQVVTITVTKSDSTTDNYYLRCLPHDFPRLTVTRSGDGPAAGWYLLAPGTNNPQKSYYVVILDEFAAALWYQKAPWPVTLVRRLPNGNIYITPQLGGAGYGTEAEGFGREIDLDGKVLHSWKPVNSPPDFHDGMPLPNGNMLMGSYHTRYNVDVKDMAPDFTERPKWNVTDAWIEEIRPDGSAAWEWHSEDHIGITETIAHKKKEIGIIPFNTIDLIHYNSVEPTPDGNIIISSRHADAVYKIRKNPGQPDDGKIIWKLGGNAPTEQGARHLEIHDDPFNGPARQHWARLLPNGHLTLLDNRSNIPKEPARAVEYEINEEEGTAKLVWEYRHDGNINSGFYGTAQRNSDGSTLIGWGGVPKPVLTEINESGDQLLKVIHIGDQHSYSVLKEPVTSFDRNTLREKAGKVTLT